jgi:uncharacterized protein YwlG (UPF0340 family)
MRTALVLSSRAQNGLDMGDFVCVEYIKRVQSQVKAIERSCLGKQVVKSTLLKGGLNAQL